MSIILTIPRKEESKTQRKIASYTRKKCVVLINQLILITYITSNDNDQVINNIYFQFYNNCNTTYLEHFHDSAPVTLYDTHNSTH